MAEVETPEYIAMLRRMLRAAGRRVGDADPEDLSIFVTLRQDLEDAIAAAVHSQRAVHGRSWADIGRGLGTSREAAFMRYRHTLTGWPSDMHSRATDSGDG